MKKKYRDIVVDGKHYTWMYKNNILKIWYNKKLICNKIYEGYDPDEDNFSIKPSDVAELIDCIVCFGNIEGK